MRKTKIVCTIGPASGSVEKLQDLIKAGMNVARLNFSHGTYEEHARRVANIRKAAELTGQTVAIMLDTKGPEIRVGLLENDKVTLHEGAQIRLTPKEIQGNHEVLPITYQNLAEDIGIGGMVLMDDGMIAMKVIEIDGADVICEVINGGVLSSRKGINVPDVQVHLPAVTEKDVADIHFALEHGLDFIAVSFVRKASDILDIRKIIEDKDKSVEIDIIAKIENREGVDNLVEIIKVVDGVMVARGDLGVEIPAEEVPLVQKRMIEACNRLGIPVITATQMLESMIQNPRPTRAETSDIANAIFDGTDAIMLSGETAVGKYPVEAVQTMAKVAERTEKALRHQEIIQKNVTGPLRTVTSSISYATCATALNLGAAAIITSTKSGFTARMVAKYRPTAPIIAVTPSPKITRKLALVWGVASILVKPTTNTDEMIEKAVSASLKAGYIKCGDLIVITAGVPVGVPGTTNLLKIHVVGDVLARGTGIGNRAVMGKIVIGKSAAEAEKKLQKGDILVTVGTDRGFIPVMEKAGAIITEEGGLTSHAAVVGINLNLPVVVGVNDATIVLKEGEMVTIDSMRGLIYRGVTTVL